LPSEDKISVHSARVRGKLSETLTVLRGELPQVAAERGDALVLGQDLASVHEDAEVQILEEVLHPGVSLIVIGSSVPPASGRHMLPRDLLGTLPGHVVVPRSRGLAVVAAR
jgi:hypothetical protein